MRKKEFVAMLLAGGQGSRLGILTKKIAKPAVPFGGKYRIIDFTLSNCYNSGIDTVGVLTQYQPLELNSYIGIGRAWDLDRKNGGVSLLPPFVREKGGEWYKGTANAIYQNVSFINQYNPKFVLILSGDHIYKMDYSKMLQFHKDKESEATIAVIEVPWKEAHRFGILIPDENGRIIEFEEKPVNPKSNYASMGVYIFNWNVLKDYLEKDENDPNSSNDFGKDIIPKMLQENVRMYAYSFRGYWKDVGTVESLWEANMDLLGEKPQLDLYDYNWPIYSVTPTQPPQFISETAEINCSLVSEGCMIFGRVEHSVLFFGVHVGKNSIVKDSIVMPSVKIGRNAVIEKCIICENAVVEDNCQIGAAACNSKGITVVGDSLRVPAGQKIPAGMVIGSEQLVKRS
ncbi:MAG: glucose-1-phosphate adenylyltransferase [Desulfotomaculum sp.]|nr:glucose-1-phosphate adenylyltransferase [Desulfotomaculum sp.]